MEGPQDTTAKIWNVLFSNAQVPKRKGGPGFQIRTMDAKQARNFNPLSCDNIRLPILAALKGKTHVIGFAGEYIFAPEESIAYRLTAEGLEAACGKNKSGMFQKIWVFLDEEEAREWDENKKARKKMKLSHE